MKVYVWSNGCIDNCLDELRIKKFFINNLWQIDNNPKTADVIIINTCAFDQESEKYSIEQIQYLSNIKKESAKIYVGGCLPAINKKRLESIFDGETFTPRSINKLNNLINPRKIKIEESNGYKLDKAIFKYSGMAKLLRTELLKKSRSPKSIEDRLNSIKNKQYYQDYVDKVYPIKISEGCLGKCSYCSIKRAKGALKSRPLNVIINDFKYGLKQKYNKFVLVGDEVGAYGQDINDNMNIEVLLQTLTRINGKYKIAIRNISPEWMIKYCNGLVNAIKTNKIDSIMIPIQSGSQKILRLMNRKYDIRDLETSLLKIRQIFPSLRIYAHFMIGFPGEKEIDFKKTKNLIKSLNLNYVYLYKFQSRPGTAAEKMKMQISDKIKNRRMQEARSSLLNNLIKNKYEL